MNHGTKAPEVAGAGGTPATGEGVGEAPRVANATESRVVERVIADA